MLSLLTKYLPSLFRINSTGGFAFTFAGAIIGAIALLGLAAYGKVKFDAYIDQYQLKRDCEIIQQAAQDKLQALAEAKADERELQNTVKRGTFDNDYLKRLQSED